MSSIAKASPDRSAGQTTAGGAPAAELPVTLIYPRPGWRALDLRELWQHRELLYCLTWRDVKIRYKQTALGIAWAVLQPVLMMVVFTIVMQRMAKVPTGGVPYPVFVYSGLLLWGFFSRSITAAASSVVQSQSLITKVYFPRLIIPFSSVGAAAVDFAIAAAVLGVLMVYYHVALSVQVLLVPLLAILAALAALGAGTLLAALSVSYRDFKHTLPFLVQIWMFATPTIYLDPTRIHLSGAERVLQLNPLTPLVAAFRAALLGGPIAWPALAYAAAVILAAFVGGCFYFRRVERRFADVI